jgi:hypothetical protein
MRANALSDITVKLSTRDDPLLDDIAHLVLELSSNGNVIDTLNLVSQEASSGVWYSEQTLVM